MTTRTVYSVDANIVAIRPNILLLGTTDWTFKHEAAFGMINRDIVGKWYKDVAPNQSIADWRTTAFDPDYIDADQVNLLSCYKTLEIIYLYLMKDAPEEDAFEREMKLFRKMYNDEFAQLLEIGFNYDWDKDDTIEAVETYQSTPRTLSRC